MSNVLPLPVVAGLLLASATLDYAKASDKFLSFRLLFLDLCTRAAYPRPHMRSGDSFSSADELVGRAGALSERNYLYLDFFQFARIDVTFGVH